MPPVILNENKGGAFMISKIAALYCCLSKHEDAKIESNSIANQKSTLLKAAQSYGYEQTRFFIDSAVIIGLS